MFILLQEHFGKRYSELAQAASPESEFKVHTRYSSTLTLKPGLKDSQDGQDYVLYRV